ncbi:hypothetical protein BVG16_05575 [Paenibacillus selenitireducens]|uniref:ABC transporter permease n=1 Tax=Paenibacillus selenitireducens TaxID=1324314 RepID=A0A1T2XKJ5_9BACL|nr:ABC transporter permease [Paenibacillus selenitireducens]OPA80213.1 hypothetical protein BVG16_05575 [Paenibacillus selenitireducens]
MLQLIRLELRKTAMGWYVNTALLVNLVIALFMGVGGYVIHSKGLILSISFEEVFSAIGAAVRALFTIIASVLISKLVLEEYKNRTITIMFAYPICRRTLLAVKLFMICGITFVAIVLSTIVAITAFCGINAYFDFIPISFTASNLMVLGFSVITFALTATGTSFIALLFGMRKHSVADTMSSSILVAASMNTFFMEKSVITQVGIPMFLAVIGIGCAAVVFRNVETVDVA